MKRILLSILLGWFGSELFAQSRGNIQLSGIVIEGDSAHGISGAHIYEINFRYGTITNQAGFFTILAEIGDTLIISAIGYKKKMFIVPQVSQVGLTVLLDMETENYVLPVVEIFPYPNEKIFKQAFLSMGLPDENYLAMQKRLDYKIIQAWAYSAPMNASENYKYFMATQVHSISYRYQVPTLSLTNPFIWRELIRSARRKDVRQKDDED
ncbi:MAG: carboxypeptidase-like regulatory domain-containing protein [Cytophagales bacterium]|nr:carboxypeptidase-like regulatory domain-containing protein [Cytophagales bacterium]MDW8384279.1 carboxypeptidase-like regulatory domain-containing protein [Flammeovirgaceae bacterium]